MLALLLMLLVLGCSQRPLPLNHAAQSDGFVDAEGGVKLHYRILGSRGDTIVVIHGGPGFSMGYIAPDIEPLSAHHVLLFYDQRGTGNEIPDDLGENRMVGDFCQRNVKMRRKPDRLAALI